MTNSLKIGTLTFHRANNYGGVLQCYALVTFLRNMGYDAEVVDYRCEAIERAYKPWRTSSLKSLVASILSFHKKKKALQNFSSFREKHLPVSKKIYNDAKDFDTQYDMCIVGSDQVWSTKIVGGFDPVYFGDFSKKIRKIGYAVSSAVDSKWYRTEDEPIMANYTNNFSHISFRESSLASRISKYNGKNFDTVIDPSLLLTSADYEKIIMNPKEQNYVLYYNQEYNPSTCNIVKLIASQIGAERIVVITGIKENYSLPCSYYDLSNLGVPQFLGLIRNAKAVVATSFHGTAYSLVFRKDFYFVSQYASDRASYLLKKVGASDRLVQPGCSIFFSKVDYNRIEPLINEYRKHSMDFLVKAIEGRQ